MNNYNNIIIAQFYCKLFWKLINSVPFKLMLVTYLGLPKLIIITIIMVLLHKCYWHIEGLPCQRYRHNKLRLWSWFSLKLCCAILCWQNILWIAQAQARMLQLKLNILQSWSKQVPLTWKTNKYPSSNRKFPNSLAVAKHRMAEHRTAICRDIKAQNSIK